MGFFSVRKVLIGMGTLACMFATFFVTNNVSALVTGGTVTGGNINIANSGAYNVFYIFSGTSDAGDIAYIRLWYLDGGGGSEDNSTLGAGETGYTTMFVVSNGGSYADGNYEIRGRIMDATGDAVTGSLVTGNLIKDTVLPLFGGIASGQYYSGNIQIAFSDDNISGATLNGATYNSGDSITGDNIYTFVVYDTVGNSTGAIFIIDKTKPTFAGVTTGSYYPSNRAITFDDTNLYGATLDGNPYASGASITGEGTHTFVVTDLAGNSTGATFTIDKTFPVFAGVATGAYYSGNTYISFSDANFFSATLDGAPYTSGATISATGAHTFVVNDLAGNSTGATFIIDKTMPTWAGVTSGAYYSGNKSITFDDTYLSGATLNGATYNSGDSITGDDTYIFIVKDLAGNSTGATFIIDKTKPTFAGVTTGAFYSGNKSITFSDANLNSATLDGSPYTSGTVISTTGIHTFVVTDLAGNSTGATFIIDKTMPTWAGVTSGAYYSGNKSITFDDTYLSGATLNGATYTSGDSITGNNTYIFIVKDLAGNSTGATFIIDKIAPLLTGAAAVTNLTSQTPSYIFTGNEAGNISYTGGCTSSTTTAISGGNTIIFSALLNGVHSGCQLKVTDQAGNISNIVDIPSFTVAYSAPSGGGGGSSNRDVCPDGDFSPSLYDGKCTGNVVSTGGAMGSIVNSPFSTELNNAYLYAFRIGITTMATIQQADMEGQLIRSHMAKMMVNYAVKVLGLKPDASLACTFSDMANKSDEFKGYVKLACQLGLMGVGMTHFDPDTVVTRAQFGTILSRALYGSTNEGGAPYYLKHLEALKIAGIMNNITDPTNMKEIRGYVMLMLMRANK